MSLALYAAPFNNENNSNKDSSNSIERKRKNRTVKNRHPQINKIKAELISGMDENDDDLADFNPPQTQSVGVERTKQHDPIDDVPVQPVHSTSMGIGTQNGPKYAEAFQNLPSLASEDYYKQFVPYYDRVGSGTISNDELTQKLDYMIHLLEEAQDFKTGHVTEEVILYSFLGVFIIFVLDSFARAGKYVR